mgnify:CR=1 FL=1
MTVAEFKNEFLFKYDAASNGGPDLNNYEISVCLTQAVKDVVKDAYDSYESSEKSKRIVAPLLKNHSSSISNNANDFWPGITSLVSLPKDLQYIVLERVKLKNCIETTRIEIVDLDNLENALNNSFKRPNKRKVVRVEYNETDGEIFSTEEIKSYSIRYIKKPSPIIVSDFALDQDLIGDETLAGLNIITNTELPEFVHDDIIQKAVIIAIKTTRQNSLESQINIK